MCPEQAWSGINVAITLALAESFLAGCSGQLLRSLCRQCVNFEQRRWSRVCSANHFDTCCAVFKKWAYTRGPKAWQAKPLLIRPELSISRISFAVRVRIGGAYLVVAVDVPEFRPCRRHQSKGGLCPSCPNGPRIMWPSTLVFFERVPDVS